MKQQMPFDDVTVAFIGPIGAGKTYLTKKITGDQSLKEAISAASVTQGLFARPIIKGDHQCNFVVLDGPGTSSSTDVLQNAVMLKALLTTYKLNAIFVVVKHENRVDHMV